MTQVLAPPAPLLLQIVVLTHVLAPPAPLLLLIVVLTISGDVALEEVVAEGAGVRPQGYLVEPPPVIKDHWPCDGYHYY